MKPYLFLLASLTAVGGCAGAAIRNQSPDDGDAEEAELVGDLAAPFGSTYVKVEAVGLVTGLHGAGSDPPPSAERSALIQEMQVRNVSNPSKILASGDVSLVLVTAYIPPGAQKGDRVDIEVRLPQQSETQSLRGGWLMESRLTELMAIGGQTRQGHFWGMAQGPLLVDPVAEGEADRVLQGRGIVLGGGMVVKERTLGLGIKEEARETMPQGVRNSAQIGAALNRRFHMTAHGSKEGIARPQTDGYIELALHPRYKDNIPRYFRVVRSVAIKETPGEQLARLQSLEQQLLNPVTAARAALRLEAIGRPALKVLKKGAEAIDPEVRFYAAEALAYLDDTAAAKPLGQAAREEPAFRAFALTALSTMNDVAAYDELRALLDVQSIETRYGAFRALWAMNPRDALIRGETLGEQFGYHVLNTAGDSVIHVTKTRRPEIVLFGLGQRLQPPFSLEAGNSIMINARGDQVTVSKFAIGQEDQQRFVSTSLDEIIRAVVDVGGTYPDVVQALQQAKAAHVLPSRLEMDAIPERGRDYQREEEMEGEVQQASGFEVSNPLPGLFSSKKSKKKK